MSKPCYLCHTVECICDDRLRVVKYPDLVSQCPRCASQNGRNSERGHGMWYCADCGVHWPEPCRVNRHGDCHDHDDDQHEYMKEWEI